MSLIGIPFLPNLTYRYWYSTADSRRSQWLSLKITVNFYWKQFGQFFRLHFIWVIKWIQFFWWFNFRNKFITLPFPKFISNLHTNTSISVVNQHWTPTFIQLCIYWRQPLIVRAQTSHINCRIAFHCVIPFILSRRSHTFNCTHTHSCDWNHMQWNGRWLHQSYSSRRR